MQFTHEEMSAIFKLAKMMNAADGKLLDIEKEMVLAEMEAFGVTRHSLQAVALEAQANKLTPTETIHIVSKLSDEQKKYVCSFLATLMAADGEVDDKEVALWTLISTLASFPTMTIQEGIKFWALH